MGDKFSSGFPGVQPQLYPQPLPFPNMPASTAAVRLAKLQADKKAMEEQEAQLKAAAEEEEQVAAAAAKAEEERLAAEKKAAKKTEKKRKAAEAALEEEAEGSGAPVKKKGKAKPSR